MPNAHFDYVLGRRQTNVSFEINKGGMPPLRRAGAGDGRRLYFRKGLPSFRLCQVGESRFLFGQGRRWSSCLRNQNLLGRSSGRFYFFTFHSSLFPHDFSGQTIREKRQLFSFAFGRKILIFIEKYAIMIVKSGRSGCRSPKMASALKPIADRP